MNDNSDQREQPRLIDLAISSCDANIRRHTRSTAVELAVVGAVLLVVIAGVSWVARTQAEQNDEKRYQLIEAADKARQRVEERRRWVKNERDSLESVEPGASAPEVRRQIESKIAQLELLLNDSLASAKEAETTLAKRNAPPLLSDSMFYGTSAFAVVVLAIFASLYRWHLREITRNEHFRFGLMRIRIAAANSETPGFSGEVREALTQGAFASPFQDSSAKAKEVQSPLPGHPTSDVATAVLNKLLAQLDIVLRPKGTSQSVP